MFIGRPPEVRLLTKTSEENRCQRSLMPSRDRLPVVPERKFCVTWIPMIEVIRNFCILVTGWQSRSVHEARPKERPAYQSMWFADKQPTCFVLDAQRREGGGRRGGAVVRRRRRARRRRLARSRDDTFVKQVKSKQTCTQPGPGSAGLNPTAVEPKEEEVKTGDGSHASLL